MAGFYSAFLDPNVKPKYKIKKDYGDTVTPAIAGFIGGMIRDTAVSSGQVVNEAFGNPYLSPVGSLFGKDFLANQVGQVNKAAGESMKGEVTPMDIVNVASLIPNPAGLGIKAASGVGRIAAKAVPKTTFMEPVFSMAAGPETTRIPDILSGVSKYLPSEGSVKVGTQIGAAGGPNIVRVSGDRAEGVYSGRQPGPSDKPGQIAKRLNVDSAKRYGENIAGLGQKQARGENKKGAEPFIAEVKRIFQEASAGKKSDDVTNNMGLQELLETPWYKSLSKDQKANTDIIQAHHYPGKDMAALSKLVESYGPMDRMEVLRQPEVRDFIADMHKNMAYGSGESNRLARKAHEVATKNNVILQTPSEELNYMLELANAGDATFIKYKGYTAKQLAETIGYPVNWVS